MPDKIVAMNFGGQNTGIIGMTKEQYALLLWLQDNGAFRNEVSFAEWNTDGENCPTDPSEI